MSNISKHTIKNIFTFLFLFLSAFLAHGQTEPPPPSSSYDVIQNGNGFKKLRLKEGSYNLEFNNTIMALSPSISTQSAKHLKPTTGSITGQSTVPNEVIIVQTLRGVLESDLPQWVKDDFFEENGQTFQTMSDEDLDEKMEISSIDLSALAMIKDQEAYGDIPDPEEPDEITASGGICSKKWKNKSKDFNYSINENKPIVAKNNLDPDASAAMSVNLTSGYQTNGTMNGYVRYKIKKRCGIPYKAKFISGEFKADVSLAGRTGVGGTTYAQYKKTLYKEHINIWNVEYDWWVYFFEFNLEMGVDVDLKVDLDVAANAHFDIQADTAGTIKLTWICDQNGCTRTRNEVNVGVTDQRDINRQVQVKVSVIPSADTSFYADLDMYYGAIDIGKAKIGVVAALPLTLDYYYGNMCSDANNDYTNELVKGGIIDLTARLHAYYNVEIFGEKSLHYIDLDLKGFGYEKSFRYDIPQEMVLYEKNLYNKAFDSGEFTMLDPVMNIPKTIKNTGDLRLNKRSCNPYAATPTYEVDWGDGSSHYIGEASDQWVNHSWPTGNYVVKARIISDSIGRSFSQNWITQNITVITDPYSATSNISKINDTNFMIDVVGSGFSNPMSATFYEGQTQWGSSIPMTYVSSSNIRASMPSIYTPSGCNTISSSCPVKLVIKNTNGQEWHTSALMPLTPISAPANVSASIGDNSINVTWATSAGATSYRLSRNNVVISTINSNSYKDINIVGGTLYTYKVESCIGTTCSASKTAAPITPPPRRPIVITAAVNTTTAALTWEASVGASHYELKRNGVSLPNATVPKYIDSTVIAGTTYWYSLRACQANFCSEWTNSTVSIPATDGYFPTPTKDNALLGAPGSQPANLPWPSEGMYRVLRETANQFCKEHGYIAVDTYSTYSNYGAGHKYYLYGIWSSYGGVAFQAIKDLKCVNKSSSSAVLTNYNDPQRGTTLMGTPQTKPTNATNWPTDGAYGNLWRTAKQFCVEKGFLGYDYFANTTKTSSLSHTYYNGSSWQSYSNLAFWEINQIRCFK